MTIEGKSFRVSRILDLNDPFEWLPGLDPIKPEAADLHKWSMGRSLKEMNGNVGILSFSALAFGLLVMLVQYLRPRRA